jgi:hypothetical protein
MERYCDDYLGRYGHILPPYTLVEDASEGKEDGDDDKDGASIEGGSVAKELNPTRLSKRGHSIMVRTNSSASVQSLTRFSKKLRPVPTESLPEYQAVLKNFPDPLVPEKDPPVQRGQEVGREPSAKAEQLFVKAIASLPKEEADRIRQDWKESKYMQPGGPTVLPERPEDVVLLPGAELAGFMPRRGDFDIEHDNDAEQALADMEFLPGDIPEDKELKLKVLRIYNEKLDEREKRKNFIINRNLHDYRKNQEEEAKMPRDERDLVRRMRLFERFHTPDEHKQFIADILRAKQLRKEIATLQMYRRMGIVSLAEADKFEQDKRWRMSHRYALVKNEANIKQQATQNAAKAVAAGNGAAASGSKTTPTAEEAPSERNESLWKPYSDRSARRRSVSRGDNSIPPLAEASEASSAKEAAATEDTSEAKEDVSEKDVPSEEAKKESTDVSNKKDDDDTAAPKVADADFAIEEMEGYELLSNKEVSLLRKIRLIPKHYLEIKRILIHESLKSGLLDAEGSSSRRTIVKIDVEKRDNAIDFLVRAGWVSSKVARAISE